VYLTEKAWEIKDNLMKMQQEAGKNITGNFSDQDIKTLEELLHKVLINVEEKIMPHI
jgi:DNA-binding MarR family transcriptional regulator